MCFAFRIFPSQWLGSAVVYCKSSIGRRTVGRSKYITSCKTALLILRRDLNPSNTVFLPTIRLLYNPFPGKHHPLTLSNRNNSSLLKHWWFTLLLGDLPFLSFKSNSIWVDTSSYCQTLVTILRSRKWVKCIKAVPLIIWHFGLSD